MSTLEIVGIVVAGLLLLGFFVVLAMARDVGEGETTTAEGIGSIDEPRL